MCDEDVHTIGGGVARRHNVSQRHLELSHHSYEAGKLHVHVRQHTVFLRQETQLVLAKQLLLRLVELETWLFLPLSAGDEIERGRVCEEVRAQHVDQ